MPSVGFGLRNPEKSGAIATMFLSPDKEERTTKLISRRNARRTAMFTQMTTSITQIGIAILNNILCNMYLIFAIAHDLLLKFMLHKLRMQKRSPSELLNLSERMSSICELFSGDFTA